MQSRNDVSIADVNPAWLTYKGAEAYTGLGRTTLWKIVGNTESGVVAAKVGKSVRINRESLDAYLYSCAR